MVVNTKHMAISNPEIPSNVLIITTSGGGGHIQAAKAKLLEIGLSNKESKVVIKDILLEAAGKFFGKKMINIWNIAQRRGHVRTLEFWASAVPIFSVIFFIPVFFQVLYTLFKYKIDYIIDTQPLCLPSIVIALRLYNFMTKKNLIVEKFLTELPTNYVAHYLKPIKRLGAKNRQLIKLYTTDPLLKEDESADSFWKKYTGLSKKFISYGDFPIRPHFKKYQNINQNINSLTLKISIQSDNEKQLFENLLHRKSQSYYFENNALYVTIDPTEKVSTLMLGSQPTQGATLKYVKKFIQLAKKDLCGKKHWLFVFCSQKKFEDVSLQKRIHDLIIKTKDFPDHLKIIPMSPQEDEVIAPLFYRSDITLTRSGGVTAMELMAVARGQIWIHKETSPSILDKLFQNKKILDLYSYKGMPKWEYGNAAYLRKAKGAQMITPETFDETSKGYLLNQI